MANVTLVANYITKFANEFEAILFEASLASVRKACDRISVVWVPNCDCGKTPEVPAALSRILKEQQVEHFCSYFGQVRSFAEVRNICLKSVATGEYFYWIDADEVVFSESLVNLKAQLGRLLEQGRHISRIRTRFIHFCLSPFFYERTEPRTTIIKKEADTCWVGPVHERIESTFVGGVLNSDFTVHHYGYCAPQREVFNKWQMYAELEGQPDRYVNEEVDGKTKPYFRAERPGPENILDDRRKVLLPYHGQYPDQRVFVYLKRLAEESKRS